MTRLITQVVFLVPGADMLSSNVQRHRFAKSEAVRRLRKQAAVTMAARGHAGRGEVGPLRVVASIGYPTARKADPPNLWPTVKALMDGVTDSGFWIDDNSDVVAFTGFERSPGRSPKGTYTVTLAIEHMEEA